MYSLTGKFGFNRVEQFPVTFGMNNSGGIDNEEFAKYMDTIMDLYPNAADITGKCIMI